MTPVCLQTNWMWVWNVRAKWMALCIKRRWFLTQLNRSYVRWLVRCIFFFLLMLICLRFMAQSIHSYHLFVFFHLCSFNQTTPKNSWSTTCFFMEKNFEFTWTQKAGILLFFPLKKTFFYTFISLFINRGNGLIYNLYCFDYGESASLKRKFTMKTKYWRKCSRESLI